MVEPPADISILPVALCSSNTIIALADTSHNRQLKAVNGPNGLLAVSLPRFEELDITPKIKTLEQGG